MFVEVLLDQAIDKPLDYKIPEGSTVHFGSRVRVPLRRSSCLGTVIHIKEEGYGQASDVLEILQDSALSQDQFELAKFISHYYCTPLQKIIKMMLPSGVRHNIQEKTIQLVQLKISKNKTAEFAAELRRKSPKQAEVLDLFLKDSKILAKEIKSKSALKALEQKGILSITEVNENFSPLNDAEFFPVKPKELSPEQKTAFAEIVKSDSFAVHLLYGVTGSGKSEVYFQLMQQAIDQGKGVLYLVPEVALTEQLIDKLKTRFTNRIALLHHRISDGEKNKDWVALSKGEKMICVGARSSVFAPIKNLKLVIVDEEHEGAYKQTDEMPCYNSRDVAIVRAKMNNATCVLGSATPSLESYQHALSGKYLISTLKSRPSNFIMPKVNIVDMAKEYDKVKGWTLFSEKLLNELEKNLEKGEQSILFLNRRGWHTSLFCLNCEKAVQCPHCSTNMIFHKGETAFTCHLCNYTIPPPKQCPSCKADTVKYRGAGTEQIEKALYSIFPESKVLRMDADTTKHKHSHEQILKAFATGKADILIGTQMIVKGLTFPQVSLVGILNADQTLNVPDYRASEIAFQQLTQVAGRSGRGLINGQVILQTAMPNHVVIQLASQQNFDKFFQEEIKSRKLLNFPPFTRLAKIIVKSEDEQAAIQTIQGIRTYLLESLPGTLEFLPVIPCPIAKIKDFYRYQFLIKANSLKPLQDLLSKTNYALLKSSKCHVKIDIDPNSLS